MYPYLASHVRQGLLLLLALFFVFNGPRHRECLAAPDGTLVVFRDVGGKTMGGRLEALGPDGVVLRTDGERRTLPLATLFRLEMLETGAPVPLGGSTLRASLIGGERVLGHFVGPAPDGLVLETAEAGKVTIRFDALRSLAAISVDAPAGHEPEARFPATVGHDVAYRASGDATSGLLLRVEDTGLVLETTRGQERRVAWDALAVLHLENDPLATTKGAVFEIETVSGNRFLTTEAPVLRDGQIVLTLRSDPEITIRIPLGKTRRIGTYGQAFVFASDLPFTSSFETPYPTADGDPTRAFLEVWYGARVNRRPSGLPLMLHGVAYEHGFAVHARSRVTVELDGKFSTFRTLVGVDDLALARPGGGIVDARVLGDGKVLWRGEGLEAGHLPREVGPLDVANVSKLVLEIDFGRDDLHVRDYATWADPVLLRKVIPDDS